jgi:hypothetical protein
MFSSAMSHLIHQAGFQWICGPPFSEFSAKQGDTETMSLGIYIWLEEMDNKQNNKQHIP